LQWERDIQQSLQFIPACGVHLRGGRENPIQIEQDGIIFIMRDGIIEKQRGGLTKEN